MKKNVSDWLNIVLSKKYAWQLIIFVLVILSIFLSLSEGVKAIVANAVALILIFELFYLYYYLKPHAVMAWGKITNKKYDNITVVKFYKKEFIYTTSLLVILIIFGVIFSKIENNKLLTINKDIITYKLIQSSKEFDKMAAVNGVKKIYELANEYPKSRRINIEVYVKDVKDQYGNQIEKPIFVTTLTETNVQEVTKYSEVDAYGNIVIESFIYKIKNSGTNYFKKL